MTADDPVDPGRGFETPIHQAKRDLVEAGEKVRSWLTERDSIKDLIVRDVSTPDGAGVANETLLIDAQWSEDGRQVEDGLVVRVAADDSLYLDADIHTQYQMYDALAGEPGIPVPKLYGYEPDRSVLGAPFFVMRRVAGTVPADQPYYTEAGFVADAAPEQQRSLWQDAIEVMCRLHQVDTAKVAFLNKPDRGVSGLEQDLDYWLRYWQWSSAGREHPTLDPAAAWLKANLPADRPTSLGWGDARVCNMIFRDFKCVAVLDWDSVNLAGGESDLAWWIVMEHAGGKPRKQLPGFGTFDEMIDIWEDRTGLTARNMRYHIAYALFRLGVIVRKLNDQMLASGWLPEGTDIATNSEVVQQLSLILDLPPAGPIDVVLPKISRL